MDAVRDTVEMVNTYGFDSEVLVASVRHPLHVLESIRAGAHVGTMPLKTLEMMFKHPMTDSGLDRFLAARAKYDPARRLRSAQSVRILGDAP
jgi:transaldolase